MLVSRWIAVLFLVLGTSGAFASSADGVLAALRGAGFSCGSGLKQQGAVVRCRGAISGYSKALNFYVPRSLSSDSFALVYHFHGFWTSPGFDPFLPAHGDFASYLVASGKNVVLIVPESAGKNATYASELSSASAMNRFFSNAEGLLVRGGLAVSLETPRVLTGHSGAYDQLGRMGNWAASGAVPVLKSVRGIGLFDSVYGGRPGLAKFMKIIRSHARGQYFSAYNPSNSAGKNAANQALQRELGAPRKSGEHSDILFVRDNGVRHMQFMRVYFARFLKGALP